MSYELNKPPTGASDLAEEYGLSDMASQGLGHGWQQNFVRSALRKSFDYRGMMDQGGQNLMAQGLLHSGAMDSKLPTAVAAQGQAVASDAYQQAVTTSDSIRDNARSMQIGLAQHSDSMQMEYDIAKASLEANEMSTWDYILSGAGLAANLVSAGSGVGLIGKP